MKRLTILGLVFFTALASLAFAGPEHENHDEPVQRAWRLIDDGALLIDVRSQQEYEAAHLEDAVNVPYDNLELLAETIGEDKERDVVVYCRSGRRAEIAKDALENIGYRNIYNGTGYEAMHEARIKSHTS